MNKNIDSSRKYTKPIVRDLKGFTVAAGGCTSGQGVPNQCVNFGWSNAAACLAGNGVGSPAPNCSAPGMLAGDCTNGTGAGA